MELYSSEDVTTKVIVPELAKLGYKDGASAYGYVVLRFDHKIVAQQGRERKTLFADLVIFVDDVPFIVVDSKNPREFLTENDRDQVISYARLLDSIAPYAALCDGGWRIFDTVSKQRINALPPLKDLIDQNKDRAITQGQRTLLRSQAERTLFTIDNARDLSRLMRRCHDTIRNLKGYDPTRAFDELSKVLFAKMFEEREVAENRRNNNRFTSESVHALRQEGVEIVQKIWNETVRSDRYREVFSDEAATQDIDLPIEAVDKIVKLLQNVNLGLTDLDVKGVAFEEFLSATYRGGGLGQYFTPREVVNFMVELIEPAIGERIIDPSCGTGGFLIRVYDVVGDKIRSSDFGERDKSSMLRDLANKSLVGIDWEQRAARTCKMNMILHGDGHAGVYQANALDIFELAETVTERQRFYPEAPDVREGEFDIVITNPPFGARDSTSSILDQYELGDSKSQKREVLLLERQIRLLRPGGRLFTVIPEGILSNKRDLRIRRFIFEHCVVKAVIRLPQDAFKMSEGAACTSLLYAVKKHTRNPSDDIQGDIFFARAEFIGVTQTGKAIHENDLPAIRDNYRRFSDGTWDGIEMEPTTDGGMEVIREQPLENDLWLEPTVNRTSLLYDRLCYVVRNPKIENRFSYTYFHPEYYRILDALRAMPYDLVNLRDLCTDGFPSRGRKPSEESVEGLPVLKVRNVTGRGIDLDSDFAPDTDEIRRESAKASIKLDDILVTSTGEGSIGRVDRYPFVDLAIADGHISIVRLRPDVNVQYLVEFMRSEYGQIQMLRFVSGSTGQTELLIEHLRGVYIPVPDIETQELIVREMADVHRKISELQIAASELNRESSELLARARVRMTDVLSG